MQPASKIFDRSLYKLHHARAHTKSNQLMQEIEESIGERTAIFKNDYETALFYNCPGFDSSKLKVKNAEFYDMQSHDEENIGSLKKQYDLIVSTLSLHLINDIPAVLAEYRKLLAPGGVFFATIYGGRTLRELRQAFATIDSKHLSGTSPRIFPMIDIRDAAALIQRAGFRNPVADTECIAIEFSDVFKLMHFVKSMGHSNCLHLRDKRCPPKQYFNLVDQEYKNSFASGDGVKATFEIITITGQA